jgi:uroporphyrinogen III methyltransferase/synthase
MGTDRIGHIAQVLVANGMPADSPVAMIRWGTTGHQQSIVGTLANIAEVASREKIGPPTVAVIGEVVKLRKKLNWFEHRPLFGQRIVVTRSRGQAASQLAGQLSDLGAEILEVPTIKIEPPTNREAVVEALLELNSYDWLVFTSPNGVSIFFDYFFRQFHDLRDIGGAKIAAVGPATANRLKELHLQVDLMPDEALGANIAQEFADYESIENLKICLLRAEVANPELPAALEALGAIVDDIGCYKTVPETEDRNGAAAKLKEHGADWITFTSSSTVQNFHARFNLPEFLKEFPNTKLASIGPETSKALSALGINPSIEAKEHGLKGLVSSLLKACSKGATEKSSR